MTCMLFISAKPLKPRLEDPCSLNTSKREKQRFVTQLNIILTIIIRRSGRTLRKCTLRIPKTKIHARNSAQKGPPSGPEINHSKTRNSSRRSKKTINDPRQPQRREILHHTAPRHLLTPQIFQTLDFTQFPQTLT